MVRPGIPSPRSIAYLTAKLRSQMQTTIEVRRPIAPTFDTTTGLMTAHGNNTLVYQGSARAYPAQGGQQLNLGDGVLVLRSTTFSVMDPGSDLIRVNDLVKVLTTKDDSAEVGKEFRVIDVSLGGVLDPTRKISCTEVEPNPFHPQS